MVAWRYITPGYFGALGIPVRAGRTFTEEDRGPGEKEHEVEITKAFHLGVHEVTVGQFKKFVEETKYRTEAEQFPLGGHGWDAKAAKFVNDPRFSFLSEPAAMVRSDLVCTCVPIVGALLASLGLLGRRSWGWSLALLMNVAVVVGAFAITGTSFWMARPYGVNGQILPPEAFGIPTAALVVFLVLLAPSVRRGFR